MRTSYKTRAYYMLRALIYAHDVLSYEDRPLVGGTWTANAMGEQMRIWTIEMRKAVESAFAPSGSEALTPSASYLAMEAKYAHEPYQPTYPIRSAAAALCAAA